jgi:hypothetical protein
LFAAFTLANFKTPWTLSGQLAQSHVGLMSALLTFVPLILFPQYDIELRPAQYRAHGAGSLKVH